MKRFVIMTACALVAAAGAAYAAYPVEFVQNARVALEAAQRAWVNVEANPVPVFLAVGTFLLTVLYHKARGKSLRESVEVAATRVTIIPVPSPNKQSESEAAVVKRAMARATRTQLLADQIAVQNRQRKLPEEILKAEKESCYTEQALAETERTLANRRKTHDEALARLEVLRKENAAILAELSAIEAELKKLAGQV